MLKLTFKDNVGSGGRMIEIGFGGRRDRGGDILQKPRRPLSDQGCI